MSSSESQQIVDQYLEQVERDLQDLPEAERRELITDLRAHIDESIGDIREASEADVRNALDRIGSPDELSAEARARIADEPAPGPESNPYEYEHRKAPGALEVAAIVFTALLWPLGVLLAWASDRWKTRDKVIATIVPFVTSMMIGLIIVGGIGAAGLWSWSEATNVVTTSTEQQSPADADERSPQQFTGIAGDIRSIGTTAATIGFLVAIFAAPFGSAVYLAARLQPVSRMASGRIAGGHHGKGAVAGGQL